MTPFWAGHSDALYGRPSDTRGMTEAERARYTDGYAIGAQDRRDGALELAERAS